MSINPVGLKVFLGMTPFGHLKGKNSSAWCAVVNTFSTLSNPHKLSSPTAMSKATAYRHPVDLHSATKVGLPLSKIRKVGQILSDPNIKEKEACQKIEALGVNPQAQLIYKTLKRKNFFDEDAAAEAGMAPLGSHIEEDDESLSRDEISAHHQAVLTQAQINPSSPLIERQLKSFEITKTIDTEDSALAFVVASFLFSQEKPLQGMTFFEVPQNEMELVHEKNIAFHKRAQEFRKKLTAIVEAPIKNSEKIERLENFLYEKSRKKVGGTSIKGIDAFDSLELKEIYFQFWNLKAYDKMVEMMHTSSNAIFKSDHFNLAFYARANLKSHYANFYIIDAVAKHLISVPQSLEEGIVLKGLLAAHRARVIQNLFSTPLERKQRGRPPLKERELQPIEEEHLKSADWREYERCFPEDVEKSKASVLKNYKKALHLAVHNFEEAFESGYDCRYGNRLLHYLGDLAEVSDGEDLVALSQEIERIAAVTKKAAEKSGGIMSNNPAVLRALLVAVWNISSDNTEIELVEDCLLALLKTKNSIEYVYHDLSLFSFAAPVFQQRRSSFMNRLGKLYVAMGTREQKEVEEETKRFIQQNTTPNVWTSKTYSYKGIDSNYIDGNFRFGAQLYAQNINNYDRELFREIVDVHFDNVDTFEDFNRLADEFVRKNFRTDDWDLETLTSAGHKKYDETVEGLIAYCGITSKQERKEAASSLTNISAVLALRLGDCRHHAQVKQLLFDVWQETRLEKLIHKIEWAERSDNKDEKEMYVAQFNTLTSYDLRTCDCEIHLPIKMQNGQPMLNADGYFVEDESLSSPIKVEEHTFSMYLKGDLRKGQLQEATIIDSFYQKRYPWGNCPVPLYTDQEFIEAGKVKIYNEKTDTYREAAVMIKPTAYAGKRDIHTKGNTSNHLVGIPIEALDYEDIQRYQNLQVFDQFCSRILTTVNAKKTAPSSGVLP